MDLQANALTIIIAILIPLLSFAASWGAVKATTKGFSESLKSFDSKIGALQCKVNAMDISHIKSMEDYVRTNDCEKIRADCSKLHISETKTLCVKIDNLTDSVHQLSRDVKEIDSKREKSYNEFNTIANKLNLTVTQLKSALNNTKEHNNEQLRIDSL